MWKRTSVWCGALLLALYVVPVYFPPGPVATPRLGADAALWTRLFPHVPGWWMALRLAALAAGAALLAWAGQDAGLLAPLDRARPATSRVSGRYEWAALAVAVVLVGVAIRAAVLPRWAQLGLLLGLALPWVLLSIADRRERTVPPRRDPGERWWWSAVAVLVAGWVLWRVGFARHDPRAADLVDMWKNFGFFLDAANDSSNALTQGAEVGVSNVYLLLIGLPFVGSGKIEPSFAWVQTMHAVWIVLTAGGVAALARRIAGPAAMVPAVAFLLFSPFMMSMAICVSPFAVMTALAAAMLLLVWRIYEFPSRADVVGLGAVAGLSSTLPHLTLWAVAGTVAVLPWLVRRRPPLRIWTIAALTGCAALVPILPNLRNLAGMSEVYVERRGVAAEMEPLIMGQKFFERRQVEALWHAGLRGPADIPLAAVLQPFAIPRFPVRLSGDVYYEPLGAALAAVGLMACIASIPRAPVAGALLAAMLLALFPGAAASAADRASLTRNIPLPVLLPVFSAAGIAVMRRAFQLDRVDGRAAVALAAAIALSGVLIFDVVNPRIVPATWLGLTLRALQGAPAGEVLLLEHGKPRNDWLHVAEIARYLPRAPLPVRAYQNGGSLLASLDDDRAAAPLIFWSPSLEEQDSVQRPLCACWPAATLYTLRDAAGLSRAFGAQLDGSWEPALPRRQWSAAPCAGGPVPPPSCAPIRAMAHDNLGQDLVAQGRLDEAIGHFREALRLHPDYATAHNSLGLALAQQGRLADAIARYGEALRLDPELAPAHNNLAMALEATGDTDEAIVHYREAVRIAPSAPVARLNLGAVLVGRGHLDEAIAQLRELVDQSPGLPEARFALADALERQARTGEAIAEYREALRDRPGWPTAIDRLAWLLATSEDRQLRNPNEAVTLAAAAVRDGADAGKLRTLAAAYAAAGRFDSAAEAAERALRLARGAGQEELARDIDARLAAYRTGRPR